jgi:hypothetical protein
MKTVLQVSLYGLVMLASGMLAFAEGTGFPNAFTIPLALLALFVTERWQLFWLQVRWANLLGLSAFGLAGWELSSGRIEARLLSLAHLLVYLTWIVLFLPKTARMYWTMCLLSVLHVAVGAVLTSTGVFGLLCSLFLVLSIWTLTLFTLNRARERFAAEESTAEPPPAVAPPTAAFLWNQKSQPTSTVQIDPRLQWVSGPFVSGVFVNVTLSAVVGTLFFLFTPRIWVGNFSALGEGFDQPLRILQTGFAEEVQLGDIGQILEGTQTVLEVRMFDQATEQPLDIVAYASRLGFDEPLFRGSVLGEYESGRWRAGAAGQNDHLKDYPWSPTTNDVVRQEFRVEPMDSGILFAMPQHMAGRLEHRSARIFERRVTSTLYRSESVSGRESLKYTVYSEKPRPGTDEPFPRGTYRSLPFRDEVDYYRRLPVSGLERLQALARQVAQPADATNPSATEKARRLVQHLRDSGEFGYTLDMAIQDPRIDAVEDFLFNRKEGHCEYFASALALMLRAVDIPARLVSGFKGGDLNSSTGYLVVQGRHAHVWVEAYLDNRWRVLDATPASRSDSVRSLAPKSNLFNRLTTLFTDTWSHRIVGLSFNAQKDQLYVPLKEWGKRMWEAAQADFEQLTSNNSENEELSGARSRALRWLLAALSVAALVGLLTAARARRDAASSGGWRARLRRLLDWLLPREASSINGETWQSRWARWWSAFWRRLSGSTPANRRVEFYERLLRLLRSAGLEPLPTQTAREFVLATQPLWSRQVSQPGLTHIPVEIVSHFYRVRFGGESLPPDELCRLESQLRTFEQEWQRNHAHG